MPGLDRDARASALCSCAPLFSCQGLCMLPPVSPLHACLRTHHQTRSLWECVFTSEQCHACCTVLLVLASLVVVQQMPQRRQVLSCIDRVTGSMFPFAGLLFCLNKTGIMMLYTAAVVVRSSTGCLRRSCNNSPPLDIRLPCHPPQRTSIMPSTSICGVVARQPLRSFFHTNHASTGRSSGSCIANSTALATVPEPDLTVRKDPDASR